MFDFFKVSVSLDDSCVCKYKVWFSPVEPEQKYNIDADMVEKFSNTVFGK